MSELQTVISKSLADTELLNAFRAYLDYCKLQGYEDKTLKVNSHDLTLFLWWWVHTGRPGTRPDQVTTKDAREFASYLRQPVENRWGVANSKVNLSPASIAHYGRSVVAWFHWLTHEGYIAASPFDGVKFTTRKTDKVIKHIAVEDLARIFAAVSNPKKLKTQVGCRDLAMIGLFLDSGIRLGELLSIRMCDLDLPNLRCTIRGKTGQRYALFSENCKVALQAYLKVRCSLDRTKEAQLFTTTDGYPLTSNGVYASLRRVQADSGVRFHPHQLRHTFALLMSRRVSVFELKELMGHSSITTTQIYVQQNIDLLGDRYRPHAPLTMLQDNLPGVGKGKVGRPPNRSRQQG